MMPGRFVKVAVATMLLAGCTEPEEPPSAPRPVLSTLAAPGSTVPLSFVGAVEPRHSRDLGFRVLGRVNSKSVDVGDVVVAGQVLASVDSQAQTLSIRSLEGEVATAEAQLESARATRDRQSALVELNAGTAAQLDSAEQQFAVARSTLVSRRSDLAKARDELNYTRLVSETDGIVTAVSIDVGQIVNVGQTALTVAQIDVREAVVDVAEDIAASLVVGQEFTVTLRLDHAQAASGRIREISPRSDAATRSKRVRITLTDPSPAFRLGSMVEARMDATRDPTIRLPESALLRTDEGDFVWVADERNGTVQRRRITLSDPRDGRFDVLSGLEPGTRVVTAGVNSLQEGQAVEIQQEPAS
ncbi:efflux RND transporter periplasmic adaptor subunit [Antarcticirhabdus aurantiaca]|uniref:Efflux RND transporter periplasmic adaptor subunit n=1 Tax=Antarcticirhabdus aurantiaca TaxID=2606717 RepID=A0ACD4NNR3_9HYPH|nr:efflux RND transporter periplasmic adaptor subunit [Antarcticirhabdus aurantiaca]WAJ28388.1 efflux RND transporter periplasmic adaptor subunit [Jeongeuplla avenae]